MYLHKRGIIVDNNEQKLELRNGGCMFKVMFFLIAFLLATQVFAQINAIFYFSKDREIEPPINKFLIDYYKKNINNIESVRGKTTFEIPQRIKVKAKVRTVVVEGNIVQYIRHPNNRDVVLYELESDNVVFDFKKKDWKLEKKKTDKDSSLKPGNLNSKVKEKDDKDKKKDDTSVTPGDLNPGNQNKPK